MDFCGVNNLLKRTLTSPIIRAIGRRLASRYRKAPVLVGGCGRSGTTLVQAIIAAHRSIHMLPGEVDAFTEWKGGTPVRVDRLYREMIKNRKPKEAHRWAIKRPYMVRYIPQILAFLPPNTKFIHVVRDPRAVCTSHHPKRPTAYWVDPDRYLNDVSAGLSCAHMEQVYLLRYEDLVLRPEAEIQKLFAFLEEPFQDELLQWNRHTSIQKADSWKNKVQPIHADSLLKWQHPEYKERVTAVLENPGIAQILKELGYPE